MTGFSYTPPLANYADAYPSIVSEFICRPGCPVCLGDGIVCEDHYWRAWEDGEGCCGAPGMPCPNIGYSKIARKV